MKIRFSFDPSYNSETKERLALMLSEDMEKGVEMTRLQAVNTLREPGEHRSASFTYFFPTKIYQHGQQVHVAHFVLVGHGNEENPLVEIAIGPIDFVEAEIDDILECLSRPISVGTPKRVFKQEKWRGKPGVYLPTDPRAG